MTVMIKNLIASGALWKFKYNKKNASNVVPLFVEGFMGVSIPHPLAYQKIMGVSF